MNDLSRTCVSTEDEQKSTSPLTPEQYLSDGKDPALKANELYQSWKKYRDEGNSEPLQQIKTEVIDHISQCIFQNVPEHQTIVKDLLPVLCEMNEIDEYKSAIDHKMRLLDDATKQIWSQDVVHWVLTAQQKKLNAQNKDLHFCVLVRNDDPDEDTFLKWSDNFVESLKAKKIPEDKIFYIALASGAHWTPIAVKWYKDKLELFVLDAVLDVPTVLRSIKVLEEKLGEQIFTYMYKERDIYPGEDKSPGNIQSDQVSCSRCTIYHMLQMNEMDIFARIHANNIKQINSKFGYIPQANIDYTKMDSGFATLFQTAQSIKLIENLSDEMRNEIVSPDGTTLSESVANSSQIFDEKRRNIAIEKQRFEFIKLLVSFLGETNANQSDKINDSLRQKHADPTRVYTPPVEWRVEQLAEIVRKVNQTTTMLIKQGLDRESPVIQNLLVLKDEIKKANGEYFPQHVLESLEKQRWLLVKKSMRQMHQIEALKKVVIQASHTLPQSAPGLFSSQHNYSQERSLIEDIKNLKDVDVIRRRLIDYFQSTLEHVNKTYLGVIKPHSLNGFAYALLRGINDDSNTRAVFFMVFFNDPSDELKSVLPRQKGGQPTKGYRPRDLRSNNACLELLENIVSSELFKNENRLVFPVAQ